MPITDHRLLPLAFDAVVKVPLRQVVCPTAMPLRVVVEDEMIFARSTPLHRTLSASAEHNLPTFVLFLLPISCPTGRFLSSQCFWQSVSNRAKPLRRRLVQRGRRSLCRPRPRRPRVLSLIPSSGEQPCGFTRGNRLPRKERPRHRSENRTRQRGRIIWPFSSTRSMSTRRLRIL